MNKDLEKVILDQFEVLNPIGFGISVRILEDQNYKQEFCADLILLTIVGEKEFSLILPTGIIEDNFADAVRECMHHSTHLFRNFPIDLITIIDVYGNVEERNINEFFPGYS